MESFFSSDCSCCSVLTTALRNIPKLVSAWTMISEQDLADGGELRAGNL